MQRTLLEGSARYRLAFFKRESQLNIRQAPERSILQGAINKAKIAGSMRVIDPSIWSLEVEASSRVSQQRFHARAMLAPCKGN